MKVNFVNLGAQYEKIAPQIKRDLCEAIDTGMFMGCQGFEEDFAEYLNIKHCVGVGSGTDALILALKACGIGPGDQVIVPSNTYIATPFAVTHVGAEVLFADPDPKTYVLTADAILNARTEKTKAVIPVHLYGQPCRMDEIMEAASDLVVIEDCAQAAGASLFGKKVGTWGHAGAYSLYPAKNLGAPGQGGAVVTGDDSIARTVRELGNVGRKDGSWFEYIHVGYNSRLDAIAGKFLQHALKELDCWNSSRQRVAYLYNHFLGGQKGITLPPMYEVDVNSVYHLFEIKLESKEVRDGLMEHLKLANVGCNMHYPIPCHLQPMYKDLNSNCPVSEELADTLLSLPMHPSLSMGEVEYVSNCIKNYLG